MRYAFSPTHMCLLQSFTYRWIGSFQLFFAFALSLPAGKLADAGYFHSVVISGTVLFTIWYCTLVIGNPSLVDNFAVSISYLSSVKKNTVLLVHICSACLMTNIAQGVPVSCYRFGYWNRPCFCAKFYGCSVLL